MKKAPFGKAGTLESNDVLVTVELNEEKPLEIELESIVKAQFGSQLMHTVTTTLKNLGVAGGTIRIIDKGALDFAIRARVITAVNRARGGEAL
ncbi:citrate lyase acyl carrier protein [Anoxynatronum buryatiense]|uniref:Citrate lyase subunit gamma (Acyl carrier protein) n=1 Tax=Anoxynatronum buryatiense TaxID=489973 RepID=A0AA46AKD1_9CLOT|nr:citrate lyase acyl carrier protein [Anoxynatronum buryatiense]SMP68498.1 citrate lyase subunit gamma (acyl carrier protein) [Anoxynatronum buryatiense]